MGTVYLMIQMGPMECPIDFHVLDVAANFNLLLGRAWLHPFGAISSSLHQKVKFAFGDSIVVIHGDIDIEEVESTEAKPVLKIDKGSEGIALSGFHIEHVRVQYLETGGDDRYAPDFSPFGNVNTLRIMRRWEYMPGHGLGKRQQGVPEWFDFPEHKGPFRLGYKPTEKEIRLVKAKGMRSKALRDKEARLIDEGKIPALTPYFPTLNNYFTKGGVTFPYNGFGEPWKNAQGSMVPGWEIFCVGGAPIGHPARADYLKIGWVDETLGENVDSITEDIAKLFVEDAEICMLEGGSPPLLKPLELASGLPRLKNWVSFPSQPSPAVKANKDCHQL